MKKDVEALKDKFWMLELLTLEAMVKKKTYYDEIFLLCDIGKSVGTDEK